MIVVIFQIVFYCPVVGNRIQTPSENHLLTLENNVKKHGKYIFFLGSQQNQPMTEAIVVDQ